MTKRLSFAHRCQRPDSVSTAEPAECSRHSRSNTWSRTTWSRASWRLAILLAFLCSCQAARGQYEDGYHPLHHNMPPGQAAGWLNAIRGYSPVWLQPVRVELPTEGTVSVYSSSPEPLGQASTPAQFSINAGHLYRLRIADMPEFPGMEVYPSVELLDHLHPPVGLEQNYPIPVVFTTEDIRLALAGQLVTRVVYLEQPQLAAAMDPLRREIPQTVAPADNALQEADRLGRPMAIVRIGGRIPSGPDMPLSFFGTGGAVVMYQAPASQDGTVRLFDPGRQPSAMVKR